MIYGFLCSMALAYGSPPAVEPWVFSSRDPSTALDCMMHNDCSNLRDFSGALTRRELLDDIVNLPLSDEPRQILINCAREKYPEYLTQHDGVVSRHADKYFGIGRALRNQYRTTQEPPTIEQMREQTREADIIERELISAERIFIQRLQECFDGAMVDAGLSDPSKDGVGGTILESLRLRADRRYSETLFRDPQRGTDLDLRSMVDHLNLNMPVRTSVEADLLEYERSWSALKLAQGKAFWGMSLRMRVLVNQMGGGQAAQTAIQSQINRIQSESAHIGIQIRGLALEAAGRIESNLPADQRQNFRWQVYRKLYPEVAGDPRGDSLRAKFTAVLAGRGLSKDAAEQIAALQSSWELEFDAWRTKAEALLLEWSDRGAALEKQEYLGKEVRFKIEDLVQQRNEIHQTWQNILDDQFPAATVSAKN